MAKEGTEDHKEREREIRNLCALTLYRNGYAEIVANQYPSSRRMCLRWVLLATRDLADAQKRLERVAQLIAADLRERPSDPRNEALPDYATFTFPEEVEFHPAATAKASA